MSQPRLVDQAVVHLHATPLLPRKGVEQLVEHVVGAGQPRGGVIDPGGVVEPRAIETAVVDRRFGETEQRAL